MPWSLCAGKLLPAPWEWLNSYSSLLAFREISAYNLVCVPFSWFASTLCHCCLTLEAGTCGVGVSLMALPSRNCF